MKNLEKIQTIPEYVLKYNECIELENEEKEEVLYLFYNYFSLVSGFYKYTNEEFCVYYMYSRKNNKLFMWY